MRPFQNIDHPRHVGSRTPSSGGSMVDGSQCVFQRVRTVLLIDWARNSWSKHTRRQYFSVVIKALLVDIHIYIYRAYILTLNNGARTWSHTHTHTHTHRATHTHARTHARGLLKTLLRCVCWHVILYVCVHTCTCARTHARTHAPPQLLAGWSRRWEVQSVPLDSVVSQSRLRRIEGRCDCAVKWSR